MKQQLKINNNVLWGRCVMVLEELLRRHILNILLEQHLSMVRSIMLAVSFVWWLKNYDDLKQLITGCSNICLKCTNSKSR